MMKSMATISDNLIADSVGKQLTRPGLGEEAVDFGGMWVAGVMTGALLAGKMEELQVDQAVAFVARMCSNRLVVGRHCH